MINIVHSSARSCTYGMLSKILLVFESEIFIDIVEFVEDILMFSDSSF